MAYLGSSQAIADNDIRHLISAHVNLLPVILEIPSKDKPYLPENDPELIRAAKQLYGADRAVSMLKSTNDGEVAPAVRRKK